MIRHHRHAALRVAAALFLLLAPATLSAQIRDTSALKTDPRLQARGLSAADVIARLRASGMTRAQVRAQLQARGYDPALADPYFDVLERDPSTRRNPLAATGLVPEETRTAADTAGVLEAAASPLDLESLFGLTDEDMLAPGELPVFGQSFFRRNTAGGMEEPAYGPVDPSYRLGAGDEVSVVLTGAVQDAYALRVTREGTLVVPDAGEVTANGLTVGALEQLLRARLSKVYSSGLTRVSVSLGRARAIQVFVIGDVERPGAYQTSATGTVLSALYRAGGPSKTGSFRELEVRRGNSLVGRIDLYDYLLHGNSSVDVRLQHGDVLFVPPVARRVRIEGAVKRPALYELRDGDGLRDAIRFAGGPEAEAALRRVQVDRILPPMQRQPGMERTLIDVDVTRLLAPNEPDVALQDGDVVHVYSVGNERRNLVTVVGEVRRPGAYAWTNGTTLADVLDRALGLTEYAYTERAHVYRTNPQTGARELVSAPLSADSVRSVLLADRDSIVVFDRERLRTREYVTVGGAVRLPGRYLLPQGATVRDMILTAGGFTETANRLEAYVARPRPLGERADTTAETYRIVLATSQDAASSAPSWAPGATEFQLRHGDVLEIRESPQWYAGGNVYVVGEVALPGRYLLERKGERVADLIAKAGGATSNARVAGTWLERKGQKVAIQDERELLRTVLQNEDLIHVPQYDGTILVHGEVNHDSTRVAWRRGMSLKDVIRDAGGYTHAADRHATSITYQNGRRGTVRVLPLLPDVQPDVEPGSTVYVPKQEGTTLSWLSVVSQLGAIAGAVATLVIATKQ